MDDDSALHVPLSMVGAISGFETRKPTLEELTALPTVELTGTAQDPNDQGLADAEAAVSLVKQEPDFEDTASQHVSAAKLAPIEFEADGRPDGLHKALI